MFTFEGLRLKLLKYPRKSLANFRSKKLKHKDFTIISNNCWGGMIYESYNLPKQSPTIGLFFMASDYIKFVSNLKEYLSLELTFIRPEKSRWKEQVCRDNHFGHYPIGVLKDIEIFFLHYHSEKEAKEKWERRCKRISWEKMIIKFNDQNGCTERELKAFLDLPHKHKVFFTCKDWSVENNSEIVTIRQFGNKDFIRASYEPFGKSKYLNVTKYINSL
jgi:uncharacterized protein (DUF1919 family)